MSVTIPDSVLIEMSLQEIDRQLAHIRKILDAGKMQSPVESERVRIWVDGGCHGNGTAQAQGYGSYKIGEHPVWTGYFTAVDASTNNEAEYQSLIAALEAAMSQNLSGVLVKMDSQLVVNQVNGKWRLREARLAPLCMSAQTLLREIGGTLEWVGRDEIVAQLGH